MVVYNSLCADLSAEFLDFLPGTIEEKLLTLQEQLGEHFPDIILQYLCGDEQNIVQIKGNWDDVQNIHEVLEAWMKNGDLKESDGDVTFAEKIEGITDGVFFDQEEQDEPLEKTAHGIDQVHELKEDIAITEDDIIFEKDNNDVKEIQFSESTTVPAVEFKPEPEVEEQIPADSPHSLPVQKKTTLTTQTDEFIDSVFEPATPQNESKPQPLVTRSGRVVKRTYAALIKERVSDTKTINEAELMEITDPEFDPVQDVDYEQDEVLNEITQALDDIGGSESEEVVVKLDKRGRKRKAGTAIPVNQIDTYLEESVEKSTGEHIVCILCNFKTTARRHLKAHLQRCHVAAVNTCRLCKKKYALAKDLRCHMKTHYPKHHCLKCSRKFPTRSVLKLHNQRYHSEAGEKKRLRRLHMGPTKCDQCDYIASCEKNLNDHIARHHVDKAFICVTCHKAFGLKKDLAAHVKAHSDVHFCEECGKSLKSKHALRNHIDVIHRGLKNTYSKTYVCDHCGELCRSKTHYSEHMNKEHLHVKPFGCPLCSMAFYTNGALKTHLSVHSEERKFVCKQCGKGFKASNSLRVHELTHLEYSKRPHACETCGKTFAQKGALQRHMRIHSGEKPYKCKLCESAFSDYSILRRHMLGVHKINSRNLCQRDDVSGNRGGHQSERIKVENISKYRTIIRTPTADEQTDDVKKFSAQDLALLRSHAARVDEIKLEDSFKMVGSGEEDQSKLGTSVFAMPIDDATTQRLSYVISNPGDSVATAAEFVTATELAETPSASSQITSTIDGATITGSASSGYRVLQPANAVSVSQVAMSQQLTQMTAVEANQQFAHLGEVVHLSGDAGQITGDGQHIINMESVVGELEYTDMPFTVQHLTGADGQNIAIQILQPAAQDS